MADAGPFEPDPGYAGEGMGRQPFLADAFLDTPPCIVTSHSPHGECLVSLGAKVNERHR